LDRILFSWRLKH